MYGIFVFLSLDRIYFIVVLDGKLKMLLIKVIILVFIVLVYFSVCLKVFFGWVFICVLKCVVWLYVFVIWLL